MQIYQVNMEEIGQPLEQYNTLNEFFSRQLKNGVRPIANAEYAPGLTSWKHSLCDPIHLKS